MTLSALAGVARTLLLWLSIQAPVKSRHSTAKRGVLLYWLIVGMRHVIILHLLPPWEHEDSYFLRRAYYPLQLPRSKTSQHNLL